MIDLTNLNKLYSFSKDQQPQSKVKPCKEKDEKKVQACVYDDFGCVLLKSIREGKSIKYLFLESMMFIGEMSGKGLQFSDLIHEKLKNTYGEDFWEK